MSLPLAIRNNPIQTVMDYVGQDAPDGARKAVAGHLRQPIKLEDLPTGLLGAKVFPFLLDFYRENKDIQTIIKTNKLWARASIDWIKSLEFPINRSSLEIFNGLLKKYTCLKPVSRAAFVRTCTRKEVSYYYSRNLTQEQIQADLHHFDELGIRIKELHLEWCHALPDKLIQDLFSSALRYLTLDNCGTLPDDSLRHLQPNSLELLALINKKTNISEAQLIKVIEAQGRLNQFYAASLDIELTDATLAALTKSCSKSLTNLILIDCIQTVTTEGWTSLFSHCQQLKNIYIHTSPSFTAEVILGLPQRVDRVKLNDIPEPAPETWVAFAKARAGRPLDGIVINNRDITDEINRKIQGEES